MKKVIIATRANGKKDGFNKCREKLEKQFKESNIIDRFYIVSDYKTKRKFKVGKIDCKIIYDENPPRTTSFNKVLKELDGQDDMKNHYHLLTYSQEVELQNKNIVAMVEQIEQDIKHLIVVGYRLRDNVLNPEELSLYEKGIAYKVPWNTCALWNKKFVYGKGVQRLGFDEICEANKNQFGELRVKVDGFQIITVYEGMEDGLAIAKLINDNKGLKYKLLGDNVLPWYIDITSDKRKLSQKVKMARKNIVLSTFMNMFGYSEDKLIQAGL